MAYSLLALVVAQGCAFTARAVKEDQALLPSENQFTHIHLGEQHSLENPGVIPLQMIEVQSGAYLGEDDIVRLSDRYSRAPILWS